MKGIVNCNLNVRSDWPGLNAPNPNFLRSGNEVDIEHIVEGEDVERNGNTKWYRLSNGAFVWSGGVDVQESPAIHSFTVNYTTAIQTVIPLPDSLGEGVVIAIVDTGICKHSALLSVENPSDKIEHRHGTNMAGVMGSTSIQVKGLATKSKLVSFKACDSQGITDMNLLLDRLTRIQNHIPQIDLVNLSLSISDYDVIRNALDDLNRAGVIIVAAGGDERIFKFNKVAGIAQKNDFVIAAGAIRDLKYLDNNGLIPKRLDCFYADEPRITTTIRPNSTLEYEESGGDSIYTAITTGMIAKFISRFKIEHGGARPPLNVVKQFIQEISFSLSSGTSINKDLKPLKP